MRRVRPIAGIGSLLVATVLAGTAPAVAGASPVRQATPGFDPMGRMSAITRATGAEVFWGCKVTGAGIDVAIIDTGIARVPGTGTVVDGIDLSFDPLAGNPTFVDGFGHGTHLASIVNGRDPAWKAPKSSCNARGAAADWKLLRRLEARSWSEPAANAPFAGMAPGARVVNVKVGAADGAVDVSQVIAGIDWVRQNRSTGGRNIKVLLLAYGTEQTQPWSQDPLALAVDRAVQAGITVVVPAGNDGSSLATLANPAINPNVVAVGAADLNRSADPARWTVADFADRGNAQRMPDVVMPGVSVQALRVPNGFIDTFFPGGRDGTRFARGSGTSQAAAVAAGWIALLYQAKPNLTPAQVKGMIRDMARPLPAGGKASQGAGILAFGAAAAAFDATTTVAAPTVTVRSDVVGPLDGARGLYPLVVGGAELRGELTLWGQAWSTSSWLHTPLNFTAAATAPATTTTRPIWLGTNVGIGNWTTDYAGRPFTNPAWADRATYGDTWTGTWTGLRWRHAAWSGLRSGSGSFAGLRWRTDGWDGLRWRGLRWRSAWGAQG
jgi:serine protease AprX